MSYGIEPGFYTSPKRQNPNTKQFPIKGPKNSDPCHWDFVGALPPKMGETARIQLYYTKHGEGGIIATIPGRKWKWIDTDKKPNA